MQKKIKYLEHPELVKTLQLVLNNPANSLSTSTRDMLESTILSVGINTVPDNEELYRNCLTEIKTMSLDVKFVHGEAYDYDVVLSVDDGSVDFGYNLCLNQIQNQVTKTLNTSQTDPEIEWQDQQISKLIEENEKLAEALRKMCKFHEENASWDKGDTGYYYANRLINKISKSGL